MPIGGPGKLKKMRFRTLEKKLAANPEIDDPARLAGWIQAKYGHMKKKLGAKR